MCEKASLAHTGGEEVGEEGDSFPFRAVFPSKEARYWGQSGELWQESPPQ